VSAASKIVKALQTAGRPMTEEHLAAATGLPRLDVERGLEVLVATMAVRPQALAAWTLVSDGSMGIPSWSEELGDEKPAESQKAKRLMTSEERSAAMKRAWVKRRAKAVV